jgi:FKBP-type peptidyl-prolyl cis-trans isomerase FkpA
MKHQSNRWTTLALGLSISATALICVPNAMSADSAAANAPASASTAENNLVTTDSGLRYLDIAVGKGATAQAGDSVSVHYTGWLQNADGSAGKKFDSSRDRGEPFNFQLGQHRVIKGWEEGVQGMNVGGERRLIIPSALAYGQRGANGVIPPNATLIFEVELLRIR